MGQVEDGVRRNIGPADKSSFQVFRYCGVLGPKVRSVPQDKRLLTNKSGNQAGVGVVGEAEGVRVPFLSDDDPFCMNVVDESKQQEGELCDCSHSALRSTNTDTTHLINSIPTLINSSFFRLFFFNKHDFFISSS